MFRYYYCWHTSECLQLVAQCRDFSEQLEAGYIAVTILKSNDPYYLTVTIVLHLTLVYSEHVIRKTVNDQLSSFIETFDDFSSHQYGFIKTRSCETVLLRLITIYSFTGI